MSPDISMELCSEASSAGGTHPVLPREEIREADFSLVLWGAFLPISHLFFFTCKHALWSMIYFWWFQFPRWVFVRCGGVGLLNMTFLYAECLQTLCRVSVPCRLSSSPAVAIAFMLEGAQKEAKRSRRLSPSLASPSPC